MSGTVLVAIDEILKFVIRNPLFTLIGAITVIQITPIKIDPWKWFFRSIKNALVGDLEKEIHDLSKDVLDEKVNTKRWNVLDFANSSRQGRRHTKEEWDHCISELKWYDDYCERHKIPNGVMIECGKYLRNEYHEHLKNDDFLK